MYNNNKSNFSNQGDSLLYPSVPYTMDYSYIDQLSKLIVILLCTASANIRKNELLDKICESILLVLCKYHEEQHMFNQRPFFKLLINIIFDITRPQYNFEPQEILNMFSTLSELFEQLQPLRFPGFSFAWLELISNRYFMPVLLQHVNHFFFQIILLLFFLSPNFILLLIIL